MYIVTSFGLVHLTQLWGYNGLLVIMVPISFGFFWGICHFEELEQDEVALKKAKENEGVINFNVNFSIPHSSSR